MRVSRGPMSKSFPINIVGSTTFGRYPTIDAEHTYNMFISQSGNKKNPSEALVSYLGYKIGISSTQLGNADAGRGLYPSVKFDGLIGVFGANVYLLKIEFNQVTQEIDNFDQILLGQLQTSSGPVYITENNKPQICISDNQALYVYDRKVTETTINIGNVTEVAGAAVVMEYTGGRELVAGEPITFTDKGSLNSNVSVGVTYYVSEANLEFNDGGTSTFSISTNLTNAKLGVVITVLAAAGSSGGAIISTEGAFQRVETDFTPGQLTFHDTYFLCTAFNDGFYSPPANNTWRLSSQNNGFLWADDASAIGLLETKPDNTSGIVRFPSGGNMIFVIGDTVTESWYDTGAQLFPYQRNNQYNIDYGCVSPDSIATLDTIAVWLGRNEKSAPMIIYSEGSLPKPIIIDGIDFKLSTLQNPEDCSAWLFRQDGHLIYHINFFSDNYSLFYDFTMQRFYEAMDHNRNHYHISFLASYKSQYFGISPNDGNLYVVDTTISSYETVDKSGNVQEYIIPRERSCANFRLPSNDMFIANDLSVTIESGELPYRYQTFDSESTPYTLITEAEDILITESGDTLISDQADPNSITTVTYQVKPKAALSISRNGGESYSSYAEKELRPIGKRQNKLQWWGLGATNDLAIQFQVNTFGRVVILGANLTVRLPG